jgi:uncharacterized protein
VAITEARQALSAFQAELMQDLGEKLDLLRANVQAEPVTATDLPPELRSRYIGAHGEYRIIVYPSANVREFQPLTRFVKDVRSVDPEVLGTPVMNFEFIHGIKEAYEQAGSMPSSALSSWSSSCFVGCGQPFSRSFLWP